MPNGKGSNRRPAAIPCSDWDAAWERTFGNKGNPFTSREEFHAHILKRTLDELRDDPPESSDD